MFKTYSLEKCHPYSLSEIKEEMDELCNFFCLVNRQYFTDTGDAQKGDLFSKKQVRIGGVNKMSIHDAMRTARERFPKHKLLVKTGPKNSPCGGSWYVKAYYQTYEELIETLQKNLSEKKYSTRSSYVL